MDEITELTNAYNALEDEQNDILARLYALMSQRRGYRFVRFGQEQLWVNCWTTERPDLVLQRLQAQLIHPITQVEPGITP